ncbi:hypothetical protein HPB47_026104 [Ixodes persulcatus]|uniref:Uncharacterized protein n=1 Tax=Ixodes persulcatus TaxID=34615 RepID=A0AC60Q1H6_IXOPE|nr:hypothetical protein HPB47_026104 [Ixodes persulcatus]
MENAGIQNTDSFTVHLNEKSNTIAITTRNPRLTSKLLNIGAVEKAEKKYEMKPYMATSSNQVRGVIYLHGENLNETAESLMEGLDCRTNNIVTARIIERSGKTVLITFENERIPKHVRFLCEVFNVMEYRPRPVVCYSCHHIGHKSDVCPTAQKDAATVATFMETLKAANCCRNVSTAGARTLQLATIAPKDRYR